MSNPAPTPEQLLGVHCLGIHNKLVELGVDAELVEEVLTNLKLAIDAHVREIMHKDISIVHADEVKTTGKTCKNYREFRVRAWPNEKAYLGYKGNFDKMDGQQLIALAGMLLDMTGEDMRIVHGAEFETTLMGTNVEQDDAAGD